MLKTKYFDIYGLTRFFSHSHWRAGECQSCTLALLWLIIKANILTVLDTGFKNGDVLCKNFFLI